MLSTFSKAQVFRSASDQNQKHAAQINAPSRSTDAPQFLGFADTRNAPSLAVLRKVGMVPTRVEVEPDGLLCQFHVYKRPKAHD